MHKPSWNLSRFFAIISISLILAIPQTAFSANAYGADKPSAAVMAIDFVLVRPILLAVTAIGTTLFVVSLPFSAAGGNIGEAAKTLVVEPGEATFVRCLGCTSAGYK
jgi:hypothetical protein